MIDLVLTMKLLAIAVYYKENEGKLKTLQKEFHVDHVSYFQRGRYGLFHSLFELMRFALI